MVSFQRKEERILSVELGEWDLHHIFPGITQGLLRNYLSPQASL